ncbi:C-type lectin domain family 4 member F-like isoform X2 [Elgaria multicarinata webbii]|uniref:C-type lectin domain family 4 member F-like isoform X2 n=1 Tax=Elgaria multicarinata webbii TaxID=159646 RepID=UPI002FCD27B7
MEDNGISPKGSGHRTSHKRTIFFLVFLVLLVLLLTILLIAVVILNHQKERKLLELEGMAKKIRTSLRHNVSYASGEASESSVLSAFELLEDLDETLSETQARLKNVSASQEAAEERYSSVLSAFELLEDLNETLSKTQARLKNVSASQEAAEERYRNVQRVISARWKFYEGSFYFFSQVAKSWHAAEQFCTSYGAHLTSVNSRQEMFLETRTT